MPHYNTMTTMQTNTPGPRPRLPQRAAGSPPVRIRKLNRPESSIVPKPSGVPRVSVSTTSLPNSDWSTASSSNSSANDNGVESDTSEIFADGCGESSPCSYQVSTCSRWRSNALNPVGKTSALHAWSVFGGMMLSRSKRSWRSSAGIVLLYPLILRKHWWPLRRSREQHHQQRPKWSRLITRRSSRTDFEFPVVLKVPRKGANCPLQHR